MRREARHSGGGAAGFSLVELIVVLAVIGILAGISIPVVRMFSQNDLQRGVRPLTSMLRAARVYAATFNVNTAVVYEIAPFPVDDTILGQTVRVLSGATVVYQLPKDMGAYAGLYVPTPQYGGEFQPFESGFGVLLQKPPDNYDRPLSEPKYNVTGDQTVDYNNGYFPAADGGVKELGLVPVRAYLRYMDPQPAVRDAEFNVNDVETYIGHVFDGKGALTFSSLNTPPVGERFRILFAPLPDEPREDRMWTTESFDDIHVRPWLDPASGLRTMGYQGQEVTIYRSTGRIKTGSLQP